MKNMVLWPALLMTLAWQCWAIQINVDTVFTSSNTGACNTSADTGAQFIIRNTNMIDTVFIDTIYFYRVSSVRFGGGITFNDTAHHQGYTFLPMLINDTFFVATQPGGGCRGYIPKLMVLPHGSLVLTNPVLWLLASAVLAKEEFISPDRCILKTVFVPNIGTRDSVIFVGPQVGTGTKFKTIQSRMPVFDKGAGSPKLYDLSGRCIDKLSFRKYGVFIATYERQRNPVKKILLTN